MSRTDDPGLPHRTHPTGERRAELERIRDAVWPPNESPEARQARIARNVAALEEAEGRMQSGTKVFSERRARFEEQLLAAVPGVRILGQDAMRIWNTTAVLMPETPDCRRRWVVVMDRLGLAVSTGSAPATTPRRR